MPVTKFEITNSTNQPQKIVEAGIILLPGSKVDLKASYTLRQIANFFSLQRMFDDRSLICKVVKDGESMEFKDSDNFQSILLEARIEEIEDLGGLVGPPGPPGPVGPAGPSVWGSVSGNLADQVDLWSQLSGKVNKSGDVMSGILNMGGNALAGVPNPFNQNDAANKGWIETNLQRNGVLFVSTDGNDVSGSGSFKRRCCYHFAGSLFRA